MTLWWSVGLRMMTLQALVALSIFELLFNGWQQLPFACSYSPGKRPMASIVWRYLGAIFFCTSAFDSHRNRKPTHRILRRVRRGLRRILAMDQAPAEAGMGRSGTRIRR